MATVKIDILDGASYQDSMNGTTQIRTAVVSGLSYSTTDQATVNALLDPAMPLLYSSLPAPGSGQGSLILVDRKVRACPSTSVVLVDLVYRSAVNTQTSLGGNTWSVQDTTTSDYVLTTATSAWTRVTGWYDPGGSGAPSGGIPSGGSAGDSNAVSFNPSFPKLVPSRVVKATSGFSAAGWFNVAPQIRSMVGSINTNPWSPETNGGSQDYPGSGGSTGCLIPASGGSSCVLSNETGDNTGRTPDSRGDWFFYGIDTFTNDHNNSFQVTFTLMQRLFGWYPVAFYTDPNDGQIPAGVSTELDLYENFSAPVYGGIIALNGLVCASIYRETDFSILVF